MCIYQGELLIGGCSDLIPDSGTIIKYDGNKFSPFFNVHDALGGDQNLQPIVSNMCEYKSRLYVAGNFSANGFGEVAAWDGQHWDNMGGGAFPNRGIDNISDMIIYKDELYIAGFFSHIAGFETHNIVKWDGEQWIAIGKGIYGQGIADLFVHRDELWVVGSFDSVSNLAMNNVAIWNGQYWCSPGGHFGFEVLEAGEFRDTLYVGGNFREIDGDKSKKWIVKYNPAAPRTCGPTVENIPLGKREIAHISSDYQIFPNPASDEISIMLPQHHIKELQVTIIDIKGKEIYGMLFKNLNDRNKIILGIKDIADGLHFLKLTEPATGNVHLLKFFKSN